MKSKMIKFTFNADSVYAEVHNLGIVKTTLIASSFFAGISFWVCIAVMLADSSYQ